ncbi:hypothetical protein N7486_005152 [Penicillium sp. IBT 16267x]|nr:hypothetical protein N7486_005152 [Penicillium sp. IBT 16267x]
MGEPCYDFVNTTDDVVEQKHIIFAIEYRHQLDRMELALAMLKYKWHPMKLHFGTFSAGMTAWTTTRRTWEVWAIINEWKHGIMECLSPKITF